MQPPAGPPPLGVGSLLSRLGPGDHGLVFGARTFTPPLLEALVARADSLGFRLYLAHGEEHEMGLRAALEASPAAPALARGAVGLLDAAASLVLYRQLARAGASALQPLVMEAEGLGYRGAFLAAIPRGLPGAEVAAAEARLTARPGSHVVLQCLYPAPPSVTDEALRLLRGHTPGRMVMPAVWRLAHGHAPPPPAGPAMVAPDDLGAARKVALGAGSA